MSGDVNVKVSNIMPVIVDLLLNKQFPILNAPSIAAYIDTSIVIKERTGTHSYTPSPTP